MFYVSGVIAINNYISGHVIRVLILSFSQLENQIHLVYIENIISYLISSANGVGLLTINYIVTVNPETKSIQFTFKVLSAIRFGVSFLRKKFAKPTKLTSR